ncbi:hypothetical protein FRB90_005389, partial [Tulasnella sp. 427]
RQVVDESVMEDYSRVSRRSAVEDQSVVDDLDSGSPPATPRAPRRDSEAERAEAKPILAQQVENSHQLLNKYTALLGQTEHTARLLLDSQWQGAEADEVLAAEQARQEALEQERREQEERERLERQEREAAEREAQEEREREAREKASKAPERGKPGVGRARARGTTRGAVYPREEEEYLPLHQDYGNLL